MTVSQTAAGAAPEDDEWVIDVNFWGVMHGTRAFLPILLEQDSGAIVNVSSVFGLIGFPTQSAYCASKFAVRGYTESLRHELRETGVRAVAVHPGGIETNIVKHARFHVDDRGNTDHDVLEREFRSVARTSPAKAAEIIHDGVERGQRPHPRRARRRLPVAADADRAGALLRRDQAARAAHAPIAASSWAMAKSAHAGHGSQAEGKCCKSRPRCKRCRGHARAARRGLRRARATDGRYVILELVPKRELRAARRK